ncbi:MAG TPA: L-threonylcarbamoyladenylate synthase [Chitinivibrionales bacterium]|nr:L-threonylcarbamoyladenylate synthase [Chitinivibrionales bacterium]
MTERIPLDALLSGADAGTRMTALANRVMNGAVFIYPTETIYGIGGRADSKEVENRIRSIKERQKVSPLILIADDIKQFKSFHLNFPPNAKLLADKFWPGNITLVLPAKNRPDGIGVRISDYPFITTLYTHIDVPIFSTSVNLSDQPYVNDPDTIYKLFDGKIDFMVDAGKLPESKPSSVVKVNEDGEVEIVREGVIPKEKIFRIVKDE